MLTSDNPDLDLSRIDELVEKELRKLQNENIPDSLKAVDPYSWNNISETLATAKVNVDAGAERYAAGYYHGWKRLAAKVLAKLSYIIGRATSVPQRRFNNAVLHTQHITLDGIRDFNDRACNIINALKGENENLQHKLAEQSALLQYLKMNIINQGRRVSLLLEELEKQAAAGNPVNSKELLASDTADDFLDPIYLAFEQRFRGSREEIRERLKVYLPRFSEANVGTEETPCLDIGSGRGEWLELASEAGLHVKGIDLNSAQVQECRDRGLNAEPREALTYLRSLPADSLGAITGFQLIEHIDFEARIALFDECIRVLKPGGFAIFETPNPQNLLVGSCDFWSDPTHIRPLYPESHRHFMELRGFSHVEILYLHPHDEDQRLPEDEAPLLAKRLNDLYSCARDYALIGYKA